MDNLRHQAMVKNAVKKQFHGRKSIGSKSAPLYPYSAEREYQRIVGAYVKCLNSELKKSLPRSPPLWRPHSPWTRRCRSES